MDVNAWTWSWNVGLLSLIHLKPASLPWHCRTCLHVPKKTDKNITYNRSQWSWIEATCTYTLNTTYTLAASEGQFSAHTHTAHICLHRHTRTSVCAASSFSSAQTAVLAVGLKWTHTHTCSVFQIEKSIFSIFIVCTLSCLRSQEAHTDWS